MVMEDGVELEIFARSRERMLQVGEEGIILFYLFLYKNVRINFDKSKSRGLWFCKRSETWGPKVLFSNLGVKIAMDQK